MQTQLKYTVSNNGKYYFHSVSHRSIFYVKRQTNIQDQFSKDAEWLSSISVTCQTHSLAQAVWLGKLKCVSYLNRQMQGVVLSS